MAGCSNNSLLAAAGAGLILRKQLQGRTCDVDLASVTALSLGDIKTCADLFRPPSSQRSCWLQPCCPAPQKPVVIDWVRPVIIGIALAGARPGFTRTIARAGMVIVGTIKQGGWRSSSAPGSCIRPCSLFPLARQRQLVRD